MDLLIILTNPSSLPIVMPLTAACARAGTSWAIFFTNDGVKLLENKELVAALASAQKAITCQESWKEYMGDMECPIQLGSQTGNSELVGLADRVLSL